jgi:hypothetical protein
MAAPGGRFLPGFGVWSMTIQFGAGEEPAGVAVTVPTTKPSSVILAVAASSVTQR